MIICCAVLAATTLLVYCRLFHADFVVWDDDVHVYRNPYINPPTWASIRFFWQHPYEALYVPLAYMAFAALAKLAAIPAIFDTSLGATIDLNPFYFHAANIVLHTGNVLLAFFLLRRLVKSELAALGGALIFAVHPLQVESVAWVAELRGQLCALLSLTALIAYFNCVDAADSRRRLLYGAALAATVLALLCKPSAVTLPFAAAAIDLSLLRRPWRPVALRVLPWIALAAPFIFVTSSVQPITQVYIPPLWLRPFVAGDSLAFYLAKVVAPFDLTIDYGRKPEIVLAHGWAYVSTALAVAVLLSAWWIGRARPALWTGLLVFTLFLLPELGLIPFIFQHYSSVSDRYAYLSMLGIALIAADLLTMLADRTKIVVIAAVVLPLGVLSFIQTGYWLTTRSLMDHNIAINPGSDPAYDNLGMVEFGDRQLAAAQADFERAIAALPSNDQAYQNLGACDVELGQPAAGLAALRQAIRINPDNPKTLSDLGQLLIATGDAGNGMADLERACEIAPDDPIVRYNYAVDLMNAGQLNEAIRNFRICVIASPGLQQAHLDYGIALARTGDLADAIAQFQQALRLDPSDTNASRDLARAKALLSPGRS